MCRCADRRAKLGEAAKAVARGDVAAAKSAASFVVTTSATDLRMAMKMATAHARLSRR